MSFPKYLQYKDSGVAWLGELPAHWQLPPLYLRYEILLGKMLDTKTLTGDHALPYLRNVDVQWDRVNVNDLPEIDIAPDELERFTLREGDILVCEGGEVGRTAVWRGDLVRCAFQKAIHRVRPLTRAEDPRYFYYCMRFAAETGIFVADGNPNTISHLTGEKFRLYRFPCPTIEEQTRIAKFLDRETAKIDELVAEQRRLMELLQEKRQAVISHAVTKGLNPRTPMKPSGIEWLGDVPAHWEVTPLGHLCERLSYGFTNPMPTSDDGPFMLTANDIAYGKVNYETARRTTYQAYHSELTEKSRPRKNGSSAKSVGEKRGRLRKTNACHGSRSVRSGGRLPARAAPG